MKKIILVLFLSLCIIKIPAQQKGANPVSPINQVVSSNNTYAVVVGISDYQDPGIPDLLFADKDAEAFANFLRSPGGGSLNSDHLRVLINNQATAGQVASALYWLVEECKVNDQVIIYFSGHGDVERKFMGQPGFLLCWDAPSRVYMAGGVLEIGMLQTIISTLSLENKAQVTIITDACHSGKLSGSAINGSQLTNANLAKQYANEIKILSCQPNEYSIEGEQWGGGRGAFSYYLVDGLYGMADANGDQTVDLFEIGRYLEDHVAKEVAPHSQFPITVGNRNEKLAAVFPDVLAHMQKSKSGTLPTFQATESKGIEEMVLSEVDTSIREHYRLFKKAIKKKAFLSAPVGEPANAFADYYYEKLLQEPKLKRLHSTMRRNYAAALQDDAQQAVNKWLKTDLSEFTLSIKTQTEKYRDYPHYLERAAILLGEQHYMFKIIMSRKHFFEGYLLALRYPNSEFGKKAMTHFHQALNLHPEQPHLFWTMSWVFEVHYHQHFDSVIYYADRANELAPSWALPYATIAYLFSDDKSHLDFARIYLEKASFIDSISALNKFIWGYYFINLGQIDEAEQYFKKAIKLDSTLIMAYNDLGKLYMNTKNYKEAEQVFKKLLEVDSIDGSTQFNLGIVYKLTNRYGLAEQQFRKVIKLDSSHLYAYDNLGSLYINTKRYREAEQEFKKIIKLDSGVHSAYNNLGRIYNLTNRYSEAEQQFKKALQLDSTILWTYDNLGFTYIKLNRYKDAEIQFKRILQLKPNDIGAHYNIACIRNLQNQKDKAFEYLEQSLKNGYNDFDWLQKDTDLNLLREQKERWNALMKKYFPEKFKETKN